MNRKQRRQQSRSKSISRQAGVTYLTVAGVIGGSLGVTSPAQAAPALITNCAELETELNNAYSLGGTINADFSGTCDFAEGFVFNGETSITGPANSTLNINFLNSASSGFYGTSNLNISNLNFTRESDLTSFDYFVQAFNSSSNPYPALTVANSTFSNSTVTAAIYAEGQVDVTDSSFINLNAINGAIYALGASNVSNSIFSSNTSLVSGAAINNGGTLTITNSTFDSNEASDSNSGGGAVFSYSDLNIQDSTFLNNEAPGYGGAVLTYGPLIVDDSSFESNSSLSASGGAIVGFGGGNVTNSTFSANKANMYGGAISMGGGGSVVNNSTFVNNRSNMDGAAIDMWSEGVPDSISNSTFWNNTGYQDPVPSVRDPGAHLFGNILANSDNSPVLDDGNGFIDLGANLFTDTSLTPTTSGAGASQQVAVSDLKLDTLALNQISPVNTGTTKTVRIGADSVARDFYSDTSQGALDGVTGNKLAATDQRGAARPFGSRYDVGAFETDGTAPPSPPPSPSASTATVQAVTETIANQRIAFAPGSSKLSASSKTKLRTLAAEIKSKGLKSVNLNGHTATLTKAAPSGKVLRVKLSRARTLAVQRYLMQELKKSNYSVAFTKSPKGAANPLKSNKTEKGRKDNRRVEITIK